MNLPLDKYCVQSHVYSEKERENWNRLMKNPMDVAKAIDKSGGLRAAVCAELSCTPVQLAQCLDFHPDLRERLQKTRQMLLDVAETCLIDLLGARNDQTRLKAAELIVKNFGEDGNWIKNTPSQPTVAQQIVLGDKEKDIKLATLFGGAVQTESTEDKSKSK